MTDVGAEEAVRALRAADLNSYTPIEAMMLLSELQKKVKG